MALKFLNKKSWHPARLQNVEKAWIAEQKHLGEHMALKFLNKKSWHPARLRNVEKDWIAEQKHWAEQRKLEELRKRIREESERTEFRQLQERASLVPKQERVEFLYDSGLSVGYGGSSGIVFKALECGDVPKTDSGAASSSQPPQNRYVPGVLFEEQSTTQNRYVPGVLFEEQSTNDAWRKLHSDPLLLIRQNEQEALARVKNNPIQMAMIHKSVKHAKDTDLHTDWESGLTSKGKTCRRFCYDSSDTTRKRDVKHQKSVKLSDEERAARLREMQIDAELHEEQRWKRLKKAEETDAKEALYTNPSGGRSFLDSVQKREYGTSNAGSSTIEESVRRRTHYLQGKSEAREGNAFRRI